MASSVLVNDRWGKNCSCKHGDVHVCKDRYNPGECSEERHGLV